MSYRRLDDLVKFISNKNSDGHATILYGINIDKFFMPSVANIIGVDLTKYKVVTKYQFACNRMHVGRDKRLPISMSTFDYDFIVSPAYDVFELKVAYVLPEYLMLWFKRKEFDRQCCFYTDADVRGGLSLSALKDIEIEIPSIEKQREIVAQYQAVENKISVNEQVCKKLEATAQALYKQWFVDFEFPSENGQPYKSSGGTMVFNEELEKEIPKGWEVNYISEYVKLSQGLAVNASTQHYIQKEGIPLLRITDLINNTKEIFISDKVDKNVIASESDIIVTRTGQVGLVFRNKVGVVYNNCFKALPKDGLNPEVLYWFLKTKEMFHIMNYLASGSSAQLDLTHKQFYTIKYLLANCDVQSKFEKYVSSIGRKLNILDKQNQILTQLHSLLLSRLATLEG